MSKLHSQIWLEHPMNRFLQQPEHLGSNFCCRQSFWPVEDQKQKCSDWMTSVWFTKTLGKTWLLKWHNFLHRAVAHATLWFRGCQGSEKRDWVVSCSNFQPSQYVSDWKDTHDTSWHHNLRSQRTYIGISMDILKILRWPILFHFCGRHSSFERQFRASRVVNGNNI